MTPSNSITNIEKLTDHLFRQESGKMVSVLTNIFGIANLELAEDVVQDTLLQALRIWKIKGIPEKPTAWLFRVAKNKTIDELRKNKHSENFDFTDNERQLLQSEYTINRGLESYWKEELIEDQQLRMMYVCCEPSLNAESQIALILKTLCGFSTAEIATAFITSEDTISKRLYRAKNQFRKTKPRFELPKKEDLSERTSSVLNAIYLLFNEGYSSSNHQDLIRRDLVQNAMMLGKLITDNPFTVNSEGLALVALMCFHAAREESRLTPDGNIILLEHQDRTFWSSELIGLGAQYLNKASNGERVSSYHLEAAIAFEHCRAPDFESTNWAAILSMYDVLYDISNSPIVALNRVVVFEKIYGAKMAKLELEKANKNNQLASYYLFYGLSGKLHEKMGNLKEAQISFEKAIDMTSSTHEKQFLKNRIRDLKSAQS